MASIHLVILLILLPFAELQVETHFKIQILTNKFCFSRKNTKYDLKGWNVITLSMAQTLHVVLYQ